MQFVAYSKWLCEEMLISLDAELFQFVNVTFHYKLHFDKMHAILMKMQKCGDTGHLSGNNLRGWNVQESDNISRK